MATAQMLPAIEPAAYDLSQQSERQQAIDSVLGTMGAEGEPPSETAHALMQSFVEGDISFDQMSEAVLTHAARRVHEAHSRRLAVR